MISIVWAFFGIQLTISIVLYVGSLKSKQFKVLSKSENTTIIIPFKNEGNRILPLLNSINKSAICNKDTDLLSHVQFIFINDHSSDHSNKIILEQLDVSFQLIKLRETEGKKYAIKRGVELAQYNRILTLDADVNFKPGYLDAISKTECKGLTILPVNMDSKQFFQRLFSVEFWFLQRLTFGLSGFNQHVLCNGANLLFTKDAFKQSLSVRHDANKASGDDIYLLKALNELKLPVQAINDLSLVVNTLAPLNISKLIGQRKRWIKKMKDLPSVLGGLFILISNGLLVYSLYEVSQLNYWFLIPIGLKILSELMSVNGVEKKIVAFFHQITYPFYLILLLLSFVGKNKSWR